MFLSNALLFSYDDIMNKPLISKRISSKVNPARTAIEREIHLFMKDIYEEDSDTAQQILEQIAGIAHSISKLKLHELEDVNNSLKKVINDN
jgi:hypothetical protein